MKIIFCGGTLMQGGAERVISILASELHKQGHVIEILLYYKSKICFSIPSEIKITFDEDYVGKTNFIKHIVWRREYIKKVNPDIVISFLAPFNMINIIAMLGLKVPIIVADRNDPKRVPGNYIVRKMRDLLYVFADGVVLQNNSNRDYFPYKIRKKSCVIPNPINLGIYAGAALNVSSKNKEIISVARVINQKNPLMLLKAFNIIKDKFPEYKLIYYGKGDLIDEIKRETKNLNIDNRVILYGGVPNVFEKMYRAKLFVLTSDYEGMPNALIEAMCMGLPVISTRVSGAVDLIMDGENGFLVECNNHYELANKIELLLSDNDLTEVISNNAYRLSKDLDVNIIVKKWLEFIKQHIIT